MAKNSAADSGPEKPTSYIFDGLVYHSHFSLQKEILMKKLWIFMIVPLMLLYVCGQSYAKLENMEPSISEEGHWELKSVEVFKGPGKEHELGTLSRGHGTYQFTYTTETGVFNYQLSYSWTEPEKRYKAGQSVALSISIEIVPGGYVWVRPGPEYMHDSIIAGFEPGNALRDSQNFADARVMTYFGEIINQSESRRVSGKFPLGSKGDRLSLYVNCCSVGTVRYKYEWVEPTQPTQPRPVMEGSFWELTSVDIQKTTDTSSSQSILERGRGEYKTFDDNEKFRVSYSFAEPGDRSYAGQSVDITLSVRIEEYIWKGQFNHMGGRIDAGFLPGISLKNPNGLWAAGVSAVNGKIVVGSDSLTVSGKFPPGQKDGKETFYIQCDKVGKILYHYRWVDGD
jgi:hypothetical protein